MNTTNTTPYELVCGLEIHAEMKTKSKMFCGCKNDPFFAPEPNMYTCPVCLGMPGGLPVPNHTAIEWTLLLGLALNCQINLFSKFDRKNYFYPDLSKGYQISQYDQPFCFDGVVETSYGPVRIRRIHLEEDTGKLQHTTINNEKVSLVDYNRSGVPLIEIVTEPDIKHAAQAKEYGKKLRQIIRYLGIGDCDMEQGGMRLEANTSLRPTGTTELPNYKVEVKNINSFRFLEQAIEFEAVRQAEILDKNEVPAQETRGWNSSKSITFSQRSKEEAEDYRYFPDPDIPPIELTTAEVEALRATLPELPEQVIKRWQEEYGIEARFSELLVENVETVKLHEELWRAAAAEKIEVSKLASMLANKKLSRSDSAAKTIAAFKASTATTQLDDSVLKPIIEAVFAEFPSETARFKEGEDKLANFFMGQVMRRLPQKADAQDIKAALQKWR